jgi:hypothetical protein
VLLPKRKRSLHEATIRKGRKSPNAEQKRNFKNVISVGQFKKLDTVRFSGQIGFITGFTGKSGAYIKNIHGEYLTLPGKNYKQVSISKLDLVNHNNFGVSSYVKQ